MAGVGKTFWAEVDKQSAGEGAAAAIWSSSAGVSPTPAVVGTDPKPVRMPVAAPEWSGVLDIINGTRAQAEIQKDLLLEQAEAFRETIRELSQEAEAIRQQVRVSEVQAREAKAEAERQVSQIFMQAEDRVRDIQAKADMQVAQARSAALRAEARAAVAEGWLKRIEDAAKSLGPAPAVQSTRQAA